MSHHRTREETPKDENAEHPNRKNEANKSPTRSNNGSQPTATHLDLENTIVFLTNMLNYFVRLKAERSEGFQSHVQQTSPVKEDISGGDGRYSGSTESPESVIFLDEISGNIPSCSNFRDSTPRGTATCSRLTSDQNVTMHQKYPKQFPSTGASGYDPNSPDNSAKREDSSSNYGKKSSRNHRKRKNNRNNTYAKEIAANFNFKDTSQKSYLSNESEKNPSTYKTAYANVNPIFETITHSERSNGKQSGNELALALVRPNIPADSMHNSQYSSVSGTSFYPQRNETASSFFDQNAALDTNEPTQDNADTAVDFTFPQIPSATGAETVMLWNPPSTEIRLFDSMNMLEPEIQHFQSVDGWQSRRLTPRYLNQYMPRQNWVSFLPGGSQSPYLNNYQTPPPTNMQSNIVVASNLLQEYRSTYGNSYEAMYNSVSTNLYSVWSPALENSNILNDTLPPHAPPSNSSPWLPYPYCRRNDP